MSTTSLKNENSPSLSVARYRFHFSADSPFESRGFQGSAWRGALGHALRKTVCVTRERVCEQCILYESCIYPYIFETPPPKNSELMRLYHTVPHPYVLQLPFPGIESQTSKGMVTLGLVLIGKAQQQLPYLIHALQRAGLKGIGPKRTLLKLEKVEQSSYPGESGWQTIFRPEQKLQDQGEANPRSPTLNGKIEITLLTPFRTKRQGHLLTPEYFTFSSFFSPLLRRVAMLQNFHGERVVVESNETVDFYQLTEQSREVDVSNKDIHWKEWTRYSSRQGTKMQMGGVVGTFEILAEQIAPLQEWLWIGQWTHNGKAATMGLGRYLMKEISQ
ncbi:MAG: CRISPR system precrRNA processing endoribonuclease RAMP protein Cas6 [Gammaproteobacteria bacterium]|jgi:hypothetical protein|nr:CRISPR system precrRNA processing endoribonuclease RAMP protein Cas6 [Gammaproteobacteria bacterium]